MFSNHKYIVKYIAKMYSSHTGLVKYLLCTYTDNFILQLTSMCPSLPYLNLICTLSVCFLAAPVIQRTPTSRGVEVLTNTTLPCQAVGLPPPTITWKRTHGIPVNLSLDRFTQLPSGALHIHGQLVWLFDKAMGIMLPYK